VERRICPIAAVCTVLSRREALNIRVVTLTLRLHDVAGHQITLFAMFNFL